MALLAHCDAIMSRWSHIIGVCWGIRCTLLCSNVSTVVLDNYNNKSTTVSTTDKNKAQLFASIQYAPYDSRKLVFRTHSHYVPYLQSLMAGNDYYWLEVHSSCIIVHTSTTNRARHCLAIFWTRFSRIPTYCNSVVKVHQYDHLAAVIARVNIIEALSFCVYWKVIRWFEYPRVSWSERRQPLIDVLFRMHRYNTLMWHFLRIMPIIR